MTTDLNAKVNQAVVMLLEETFETIRGIYLDKETSIFETLATISAQEASQPNERCATIAAHVAHMTYYIDILLQLINGEQPQADWGHIWQTVSSVNDDEWQSSQQALRDSYQKIRKIASEMQWADERQLAGAMGIIAHNAYHLGEIRQMLCKIKAS